VYAGIFGISVQIYKTSFPGHFSALLQKSKEVGRGRVFSAAGPPTPQEVRLATAIETFLYEQVDKVYDQAPGCNLSWRIFHQAYW
jgi:hypothetical protein